MRNIAKVLTVVAPALVLSTLPVYADGPFQYHPVAPCRFADTRSGNGGVMAPAADRSFQVQGVCGVPSGAKAVSVNVTVVATGGAGYVTLYPSNVARPVNVLVAGWVHGCATSAAAAR